MSTAPRGVRALVADDQPVALAGTAQLLTANGLDVCAIVDDLARLGPTFELQTPDVVLLETSMGPRGAAIAAIAELLDRHPPARVIAFTADLSLVAVENALDVGCRGVVPKTATMDALIAAIRVVVGGDRHLHPRAVALLLGRRREPSTVVLPTTLSARERSVLLLVAEGSTNREIGDELGISETTVKTHVGNVLRKLDATDRTQAVARGLRSGLIV